MKRIAVAIAVLAASTACAGAQPPAAPPEKRASIVAHADWRPATPLPPMRWLPDDEKLALRDAELANRRESLMKLHELEAPEVDLIRWTTFDEGPRVWAECIQDAGFDVVYVEDGGIRWNHSSAGNAAAALAEYVCIAQYTRDPSYPQRFTDEQWGVLYDFTTQWWLPCLQNEGFTEFFDLTTRESFISQRGFPPEQSAGSLFVRNGVQYDSPEGHALIRRCPPNPPDTALYPS